MENNTFIWVAVIAAVAVAAYFIIKWTNGKRPAQTNGGVDLTDVPKDLIDRELTMAEVSTIFRSMNLTPAEHTPVIADGAALAKSFAIRPEGALVQEGYVCLVLGIYVEKEQKMSYRKIVFAKSFDARLQEALATAVGNNPLIVLS